MDQWTGSVVGIFKRRSPVQAGSGGQTWAVRRTYKGRIKVRKVRKVLRVLRVQ